MIVYVEAVLLDNLCLDALLAYLTLSLAGRKIRRLPIFFSALFGSAVALLYPIAPSFLAYPVKVATLLSCSAIFSYKTTLRGYLIDTFVYSILSFLLCGILSFLLGGKVKEGFIGISFGGAIGALSLGGIFLLYAVRQVRGLIKEKRRKEKFTVAELVNGGKSVRIGALFDSGNLLTDAKGEGVAVTDGRKLAELGELDKVGEMKVHTASGSKVLPLVKIPEIKIYSQEGENILTNVTAALSDLPDEYALILPCD